MNVREALEFAKKNRVQVVDLKFVDLIGTWQHFTIPASELTEDLFKDGSGLDGSSIRGWKAINSTASSSTKFKFTSSRWAGPLDM